MPTVISIFYSTFLFASFVWVKRYISKKFLATVIFKKMLLYQSHINIYELYVEYILTKLNLLYLKSESKFLDGDTCSLLTLFVIYCLALNLIIAKCHFKYVFFQH